MNLSRIRTLGAALLAAVLLVGCAGGGPSPGRAGDRLAVSAAFYPLEFAAERVGGAHVRVEGLTAPGAEPHELELTPGQVAGLRSAKLVVYLAGFQPAVDDAVRTSARQTGFDVGPAADLVLDTTGGADTKRVPDPHFWLDPVRYAAVVRALGERLARLDPDHGPDYAANAARLVAELDDLDADFTAGLADCASRDLVTSHAAFGYLAARYDLVQRSVAGLSPDQEPDAAALARLIAYVRTHGIRTVYTEPLTSPALAQTLARESGARVAVLDPVEGVTPQSKGSTYVEIMRANLATLAQGQQCR